MIEIEEEEKIGLHYLLYDAVDYIVILLALLYELKGQLEDYPE